MSLKRWYLFGIAIIYPGVTSTTLTEKNAANFSIPNPVENLSRFTKNDHVLSVPLLPCQTFIFQPGKYQSQFLSPYNRLPRNGQRRCLCGPVKFAWNRHISLTGHLRGSYGESYISRSPKEFDTGRFRRKWVFYLRKIKVWDKKKIFTWFFRFC